MVLEVLRHCLTGIQTRFDLRMRDVTTYDDRAVETQACTDRIFRQDLADVCHRLVEVDTNGIAFAGLTQLRRDEGSRVIIEFLDPDTVFVDLTFDITVGRTRNTQTDRTGSTVTRQTNDAYVMRHIFTAELRTQTNLVRLLQQLLLELDITESTSGLVAGSRQTVIEMRRSQFDGQQVLLRRRTADDDGDMIRRTSSRTEGFHLLHEEGDECTRVLDTRFGLLVEIGLVRRTATLGHTEETVLRSFGSLEIDLRRQVTFRIHLVIHVQRRVLRIAQVTLRIGIIDASAQRFLVGEISPDLLSFLAVDDGGTGILAQRQLTFASHFGIAQEGERYVFIVRGSFGVAKDLRYLLVMRTTQHETHVVESLLRHQRQRLRSHFQNLVSFKLADRHIVLGQQIILCFIFTELKHRCILKFSHIFVIFYVHIKCGCKITTFF